MVTHLNFLSLAALNSFLTDEKQGEELLLQRLIATFFCKQRNHGCVLCCGFWLYSGFWSASQRRVTVDSAFPPWSQITHRSFYDQPGNLRPDACHHFAYEGLLLRHGELAFG